MRLLLDVAGNGPKSGDGERRRERPSREYGLKIKVLSKILKNEKKTTW